MPLCASNQQSTSSQVDTSKKLEQIKPTPLPSPNPDGVYRIGNGIAAPKLIYSVEPEFSEKARQRKISATILVQLIVEADGHVRDVHVIKSAADNYTKKKDHEAALTLDQKAIEVVSQYRFEPSTFQGKPVPVELKVEVNYQIFGK